MGTKVNEYIKRSSAMLVESNWEMANIMKTRAKLMKISWRLIFRAVIAQTEFLSNLFRKIVFYLPEVGLIYQMYLENLNFICILFTRIWLIYQIYLEKLYFVFTHRKLVDLSNLSRRFIFYFYSPEVGCLLVDCGTDAGVSRNPIHARRYASTTFIAKSEKVCS